MIFTRKDLKLPIRVDQCPIVDVTCEIRFESPFPPDAVFGAAYAKLQKEAGTPKPLPILALPSEIRNTDATLAFQPHYRFESQSPYVTLLGPRSLAIGRPGEYEGWKNYSETVQSRVKAVVESEVVAKITRIGLRYINFFAFDIFNQIDLTINFDGEKVSGEEMAFSCILQRECRHLVQIKKDIKMVDPRLAKLGNGSVIDIDSFVTEPPDAIANFAQILEKAHVGEKTIFFSLLKPEFVKSLNPVYV